MPLGLFALAAAAQLPPDEHLKEADQRQFLDELDRLNGVLVTANDRSAVELQIANTYAAGGQFSEAMRRLRMVVRSGAGFDPSRDPDFARLRGTEEFRSLLKEEVVRQTPPIHRSRRVAVLNAGKVRPESIAFDVKRSAFVLGNAAGAEIVRCGSARRCSRLASAGFDDKGYVLGVKIDGATHTVWAAWNAAGGASLRCYDLANGQPIRSASLTGKHVFNDLTISSDGVVYVTDTAEGSVYRLPASGIGLERVAAHHPFTAANGIALSVDEKLLYVSAWRDGIDAVDLRSGTVRPVMHPARVGLTFIDGLYALKGRLIAIQNGPMVPRIAEFRLSGDGLRIERLRVLERRNPAFDGITTGAVADGKFYYVANPQTDKGEGAAIDPLQVFRLRVGR